MLRVVLPLSALAADVVGLVIMIHVLVAIIDVHIAVTPAAAPTPASAPSRSERESGAPGQTHSGVVTRIFIGIVRILGLAINHYGIVRGDIDHLRIGLLDHDHLLATLCLGLDFLLRAGF
jgi:hypothetical protein